VERLDTASFEDEDGGDEVEDRGSGIEDNQDNEDSGLGDPVTTGDCSGGGSAGFCTGRGEARGASDGEFPALFQADFDGFTEICRVTTDAAWLTCELSRSSDCSEAGVVFPVALNGVLYVCAEASDPGEPAEGTCTIETGAGPLEFRVVMEAWFEETD
jgi:hypothetical protein